MKISCPKCKGRGTTFNKLMLGLTIGLPIALISDAVNDDDDTAITRKECSKCSGKGTIKV